MVTSRFSMALFQAIAMLAFIAPALSQSAEEAPSEPEQRLERLAQLIEKVAPEAQRNAVGNVWAFTLEQRSITVVTDTNANRMRIVTPIAPLSVLTPELSKRMLQANFDTALDARYAIARGLIWGTFIHPLSSLTDEDFLSGLGQTVNIATTFGTTFQSGALSFWGGDSQEALKELLKELLDKKDEEPA